MQSLRRVSLAAALFVVASTAARASQAFCGFYVGGAGARLQNDATEVVLMREGLRTVLSMANHYKGPPESFALVVPVPVVLQQEHVRTLPGSVFERLDTHTAPRLVEYWEQDPCAHEEREQEGWGGFRKGGARSEAAAPSPMASAARVRVEAEFVVGEYQIVILSTDDSSALETWLHKGGYNIPSGAEPYLRPYVVWGSKFFVAKVDVTKVKLVNGAAMLSPLRFHYDSDRFQLPIRLGLINAGTAQDLVVHILARDGRYETANYPNAFIPTNLELDASVKDRFGAFYAALFDRTRQRSPGAVITEYAWDVSRCDPCPTPVLSDSEQRLLGADVLPPSKDSRAFTITRLHTRYSKESLGDDLVFRKASPVSGGGEHDRDGRSLRQSEVVRPERGTNEFQGRYILRHPWREPVECEAPRFGVWGGPPGRGHSNPRTAHKAAFVPRDESALDGAFRVDVPSLNIVANAPAFAHDVRKPPWTKKASKTLAKVAMPPVALLVGLLLGVGLVVRIVLVGRRTGS